MTSLEEIEVLQKSIVDNSLDGTVIIDSEFNILYLNEVVLNIFGYNEKELIGQDLRSFISIDFIVKVEDFYLSIINKPTTFNKFEFEIINSFGEVRNVFASVSSINDFRGHRALISQLLDVTEIKAAGKKVRELNQELEKRVVERTLQLEEALSELKTEVLIREKTEKELQKAKEEVTKALEQEKELNTLKSRFISMISHEYRTPLTVILTSTYLVEQYYEGTNKEQFTKFTGKIRASVKSMIQLLEDVLTIGKNESGKITYNIDKIRLIDFCSEILEECRVIDNNKHKFLFNYTNIDLEIISDVNALKHVISNLLTNAAKYSEGAEKVILSLTDIGDQVKFEVIDFGIGIPEEDIPFIFEAFHRANNVGAISGTGLGLSIVKNFVNTLYGQISVQSKSNEGSKFTLTIPKDIYKMIKPPSNV